MFSPGWGTTPGSSGVSDLDPTSWSALVRMSKLQTKYMSPDFGLGLGLTHVNVHCYIKSYGKYLSFATQGSYVTCFGGKGIQVSVMGNWSLLILRFPCEL